MDGELSIFVKSNAPCIVATMEYGHETTSQMGMKQGMINGKMQRCIAIVLARGGSLFAFVAMAKSDNNNNDSLPPLENMEIMVLKITPDASPLVGDCYCCFF